MLALNTTETWTIIIQVAMIGASLWILTQVVNIVLDRKKK